MNAALTDIPPGFEQTHTRTHYVAELINLL